MAEDADSRNTVLGIDVGSVSLSIVQLNQDRTILTKFHRPHKGNLRSAFSEAGRLFDLSRPASVACTSSSSVLDKNLARNYNMQVAVIAATRQLCQEAVSVLHIGAEKFMLIKLDKNGITSQQKQIRVAAGTGSFLDQQAARLNLPGIEELCEKAKRNTGDVPVIASRCAVFANTDIIHAQQRGFSVSSICNSLCFGLAENIFNTVFNREQPEFPILMTGGVSRNTVVKDYLEKRLKTTFLQHEDSCLFGAIGAALLLLEEDKPDAVKINSLEDLLLPTDNGR